MELNVVWDASYERTTLSLISCIYSWGKEIICYLIDDKYSSIKQRYVRMRDPLEWSIIKPAKIFFAPATETTRFSNWTEEFVIRYFMLFDNSC